MKKEKTKQINRNQNRTYHRKLLYTKKKKKSQPTTFKYQWCVLFHYYIAKIIMNVYHTNTSKHT